MRLSQEQIDRYHDLGFLLIESAFDAAELRELRDAFLRDREVPGEHRVMEDGGQAVRAVYASHLRQPSYAALVRSPQLLEPTHQLLGTEVHVYQLKVNAKPQFAGAGWAWHQDYMAWKIADALPAPRLLNVAVFLDDITEFNGPIIVLPGTHRLGLVQGGAATSGSGQHLDPDEIAITPDQMVSLAAEHGMQSVKGPAGSVAFFSPEIVHGSAQNVSPMARVIAIVTYNDVANQSPVGWDRRPEYLVGRDPRPLEVGSGVITSHAREELLPARSARS
ncbi:MAG: hypothetical protein AUI14_05455 [Actinobacteria bacterium 13_2_20CM_2_71_6]|nr:MAG: hypothetical protein AUI14_05455 [Actinobacteria bacterium 13_2_20CM_2_71_6]